MLLTLAADLPEKVDELLVQTVLTSAHAVKVIVGRPLLILAVETHSCQKAILEPKRQLRTEPLYQDVFQIFRQAIVAVEAKATASGLNVVAGLWLIIAPFVLVVALSLWGFGRYAWVALVIGILCPVGAALVGLQIKRDRDSRAR